MVGSGNEGHTVDGTVGDVVATVATVVVVGTMVVVAAVVNVITVVKKISFDSF